MNEHIPKTSANSTYDKKDELFGQSPGEFPEDEARWEDEGGSLLETTPRLPNVSTRVRRNRAIEERMMELTEQLLGGEKNA